MRRARAQVLPQASDEVITDLEHNVSTIPPVSELLATGMSLEEIMAHLLNGPGVDKTSTMESAVYYGPCEAQGLQVRGPPRAVPGPCQCGHCRGAARARLQQRRLASRHVHAGNSIAHAARRRAAAMLSVLAVCQCRAVVHSICSTPYTCLRAAAPLP